MRDVLLRVANAAVSACELWFGLSFLCGLCVSSRPFVCLSSCVKYQHPLICCSTLAKPEESRIPTTSVSSTLSLSSVWTEPHISGTSGYQQVSSGSVLVPSVPSLLSVCSNYVFHVLLL